MSDSPDPQNNGNQQLGDDDKNNHNDNKIDDDDKPITNIDNVPYIVLDDSGLDKHTRFDGNTNDEAPLRRDDEPHIPRKGSLGHHVHSYSSMGELHESLLLEDEMEIEKRKKRTPNPGTNIADIRSQIDFHQYGKRFYLVGLNYECHTFRSVQELIQHFNTELNSGSDCERFMDNRLHEAVWIDVQSPTLADMKRMEKYFGLHPLTTEDIINSDTGEKWELFSDYMYVVFTGQVDDELPPPSKFEMQSSNETQLHILVYMGFVITIHDRPIKGLDLLMKRIEAELELDLDHSLPTDPTLSMYKYDVERSKIKKISSESSFMSVGSDMHLMHKDEDDLKSERNNRASIDVVDIIQVNVQTGNTHDETDVLKKTLIPTSDWVLYAFLDAMVDTYIPFVDSLSLEVDNLDDLVFVLHSTEQDDLLKRLGLSKRNVATLRRLLLPKQKMTTYLVGQHIRFLSQSVQLYLRDVLDHLQICLEKLEVARENLNQTHNNYLTKVQIEIAESSSRTDVFMNRITLLASFFGPPTLIAGIFGMNVKVPGQELSNLYWFFGILGGMVILTLLQAILLRKKLFNVATSDD